MITLERQRIKEAARVSPSILRQIFGSAAILTVLIIVVLDGLLIWLKPLSYFDVTEFVPLEQNPMVAKLKSFIESPSQNPECYILGSSLMLFPAVRCDEELQGKRHRYDAWFIRHGINGALSPAYVSKVFSGDLGRSVSVVNLGVQGSIISDQLLVLKRALEKGKTPGVVFLEVAPRAFLDNWHKQTAATPIHQVLADLSSASPLFENGKLNRDSLMQLPGYFWYFYKVKADYRTLLVNLSAAVLDRPLNSWEAVRGIRHKPVQGLFNPEMEWNVEYTPGSRYHDLGMYKEVYNPPDAAFWKLETTDLHSFLDLARKNHVRVVVVDMPLTERNLELLDKNYLRSYRALIDQVAEKTDVIRLAQSGDFVEEDFEDSAHLNAAGGRKLFKAMAEHLHGILR